MKIVYDRTSLRLKVDTGDPLDAEALETWREASVLARTCIEVLPPNEADAACEELACSATRALTNGRDNAVIALFNSVDRKIRDAEESLRRTITRNGLIIFAICLSAGFFMGISWVLVEPHQPWLRMPEGPDLAINFLLVVFGWTGFTLVGFSVGWLFSITTEVRFQDRKGVVRQAVSLRQKTAHIAHNILVCLIIVIVMFFFGGFDQISKSLSDQLTSAPWAILLGLVVGVFEPGLSDRVRGFLKLS